MLFLGVVAAAVGVTSSPAPKRYQDVHVRSVALRVPFPKGYCLPNGKREKLFSELAAGDHRNVTLLTLVDCKPHAASNRYLILKAPVSAWDVSLDRSDMIKELSTTMADADVKAELNSIPRRVAADKSASTGVQTEVVGKFAARGHDDICVYMGGPIATTKLGVKQNQAGGTCVTVVGTRLIALNAYQDTDDPEAFKSILPKMRAWALDIRAVR